MKIQARLTFDTVPFNKNTDAHLVVSLKAPKIDWQAKRPHVCIIPIIDISPSMEGQKMEYAKQSVLKLIDNLQPGDFCGIVAFGGEVFVVSKPVEVTQARKDELKLKVGQLRSNGSTNFSGGMCQGLELLNKGDLPGDMLLRAIMFTDGMPNTGIATKHADIVKLLAANLGIATLSAFGYGADADQELLADVAKTGKGNYAFIRNPEDALSAFAKELGGLLSTYAQNLVIEVSPHNGHLITETVSDVTATEDGKKVLVKLPEILSEEERHVVFGIKLDAQPKAFPRQSSVFDVTVRYDSVADGKKKAHEEVLKVKVQFVKEDDAQKKATPDVDRIVGLAQLVQQQIKAEQFAKVGNYSAAYNALAADEDHFIPRGLGDLHKVAQSVAGHVSSHAQYAASSGYLGSMRSVGTRSVGTSSLDPAAAADYGVVGVSMSNSAQDQMAQNFGGVGAGVVGVGDPSLAVNPNGGVVGVSGTSVGAVGVVVPSVTAAPNNGVWVPNVVLTPSLGGNLPPVAPAPVALAPAPSKVTKEKSNRW